MSSDYERAAFFCIHPQQKAEAEFGIIMSKNISIIKYPVTLFFITK